MDEPVCRSLCSLLYGGPSIPEPTCPGFHLQLQVAALFPDCVLQAAPSQTQPPQRCHGEPTMPPPNWPVAEEEPPCREDQGFMLVSMAIKEMSQERSRD